MATLHDVESQLAAAWPPQDWDDLTVLLAVSGGPDSVALLRAMTTLKRDGQGRMVVAHVNHGLRGEESEADEAFVVELCRELGVRCEVRRAPKEGVGASCRNNAKSDSEPSRRPPVPNEGSTEGLEAAARSLRYDLLGQVACGVGARYVATAHTADDQAETILHRILRGTGIAGLSGIARARPLGPFTLIRPLLGVHRAQLLGYLENLGQPYRNDASNADTRFTRNRIRHELLPELAAQFNSGVVDALLRLGSLAGEAQAVIDGVVERLREECVVDQGREAVRVRVGPLVDEPRYVVRELLMAVWRDRDWPLQAMGFAQWDLLAHMVLASGEEGACLGGSNSTPLKQTFPGAVTAEAESGQLRLWQLKGPGTGDRHPRQRE